MAFLLIEDDEGNAHYICKGLEQSGRSVLWCKSIADGLAAAASRAWELLILDRMLPQEADGLTVIQTLRARGDHTPVLVLSALANMDERVHGLRQGADDYLTKPFAIEELTARCDALLRRSGSREEVQELQVADLRLDLKARRVERAGQAIALQPREFDLLAFLVRHHGQVVTRTMLLESLWNYHFDPQTNVIDVQISRLRSKIDKNFSPPLLHTVRGYGYMIGNHE